MRGGGGGRGGGDNPGGGLGVPRLHAWFAKRSIASCVSTGHSFARKDAHGVSAHEGSLQLSNESRS